MGDLLLFPGAHSTLTAAEEVDDFRRNDAVLRRLEDADLIRFHPDGSAILGPDALVAFETLGVLAMELVGQQWGQDARLMVGDAVGAVARTRHALETPDNGVQR